MTSGQAKWPNYPDLAPLARRLPRGVLPQSVDLRVLTFGSWGQLEYFKAVQYWKRLEEVHIVQLNIIPLISDV